MFSTKTLSKIKSLSNFMDSALSRTEMRNVVGGATFNCNCTGHAGSWKGTYSSSKSMENAINTYCRNGGSCKKA